MSDYLKKLLGGFAIGTGFTIAAVAIIYVSTGVLIDKVAAEAYSEAEEAQEQMSDSIGFKRFSPDAGLRIKSHRKRPIQNGIEILAEVENAGKETWSSVSIEVELFDGQEKFVDECSSYVRGKIAPNEVKNTKVRCGGCKDSSLPEFATYKISIVDASSF